MKRRGTLPVFQAAPVKPCCCSAVLRFALVVVLLAGFAQGPATAQECGIASAHGLATKAGCDILKSGGNAFDAAVAVAAALAVVEPFASGIGGGGFFLLHRGSDAFEVFVDARETAPRKATREFFLDENGQPRQKASLEGPTAAGIPGTPAALDWVAGNYGRLPLARALQPAIRLAEEGYPADARYVWATGYREALLKRDINAASIFLDGGRAVAAGFMVKQPQLARTLRMLAAQGRQGFYRGAFAHRLVEAVRAGGGLWELSDLQSYRVIERPPVKFSYRGATITSAPLPSSGGLLLAQSLFILEPVTLAALSETGRVHYTVEALRRGYHDRARYMGDPDFVAVPVEKLVSRKYAGQRAASIDPERATPSAALAEIADSAAEGKDTTHFSVIDAEGNRVAATLSVNAPFGSGFVAGDTGVLLNNHMNDFSLAPSAPNIYKLVGNEANAIEAGKRPLSSMSPTFVEDERGVLVLGTPGGSRIISMVLEGILAYVEQPTFDLKRMLSAPRYHHQYLPDRIEIEPGGFSPQWVQALRTMGHAVEEGGRKWGNMQGVFFDKKTGSITSANDPRGQAGVLF
ncbi:MAG TPA: gamma-glutamyltransferase [Burkholderiales bacterium]|nr:gamma-glutamyltransferase [Burkholderiales bacterium]